MTPEQRERHLRVRDRARRATRRAHSTLDYWEGRYRRGAGSGSGSRGKFAAWKAEQVTQIVTAARLRSVLDIGCGDGVVAGLVDVAGYRGVDPSPAAVETAREAFPDHQFDLLDAKVRPAAVHLSLDVIPHLVHEGEYRAHLHLLFAARRLVIVHSTDHDELGAVHVRHRRWTVDVPPGWGLVERHDSPLAGWSLWVYQRTADGSRGSASESA